MVWETLIKIRAWLLFGLSMIFCPIFLIFVLILDIFRSLFKRFRPKKLRGEIALVTGAAHGLGRCIAIELAKKGCHIAAADINYQGVEETVKLVQAECNVKAKAYKVDVSNYDDVTALKKQITEELGMVTILINNAGIIFLSDSKQNYFQEVQKMINVNLQAHFWTIDIFLPSMKAQKKGHIVAISSLSGMLPWAFHSHYTSTKYAVRGMMRSLRMQLKTNREFYGHIGATTIFPSFLKTHEKVESIVKETGIDTIYPTIKGEEVAKRIILGIQRNEEEIVIPAFFGALYKLHELLPTYWQDFILNTFLTRLHKKLENS